jgi:hypothetical protein
VQYYLWQNRREAGDAMIYSGWPQALGVSFITGRALEGPVPPITIEMNQRSQGRLTDNVLMTGPGRVFSHRLVQVLTDAGVDNIQVFPCTINNVVTGDTQSDFLAVNVVGAVACIDRSASEIDDFGDGSERILAWDYLTLNEDLVHGALMFVLAEMPVQIVVHESIKAVIEAADITGVEFIPQGDHSFVPSADDMW